MTNNFNKTANKTKWYIIRLLILFGVIYVIGSVTSGGSISDLREPENNCLEYSNIANNVMVARHKGASKQSLVNQAKQGDPELYNLFRHYIEEAYKVKPVSGDENIKKVARQFANKYYQQCLRIDG